MSLICCPECGKAVSDSAERCPECGYSIEKYMSDSVERTRIQSEKSRAKQEFLNQELNKKNDLINELKRNPALLDKTMNGSEGERPTLYRIYEYHNGKLWVSLCTGWLDDSTGRIYEGYYCRTCKEAYIDSLGFIRTKIDDQEHGKIGTFNINNKIPEDNELSSHPYPCYRQSSNDGGCYIATCVYGSYDCPEVWLLRRYRDYVLEKTLYGRIFIKCYYWVSPKIVKIFGNYNFFHIVWKKILNCIVNRLKKKGFKDTKYYDR